MEHNLKVERFPHVDLGQVLGCNKEAEFQDTAPTCNGLNV